MRVVVPPGLLYAPAAVVTFRPRGRPPASDFDRYALEMLHAVAAVYQLHGRAPKRTQLALVLGLSSVASVIMRLHTLRRRGLVDFTVGSLMSLTLTAAGKHALKRCPRCGGEIEDLSVYDVPQEGVEGVEGDEAAHARWVVRRQRAREQERILGNSGPESASALVDLLRLAWREPAHATTCEMRAFGPVLAEDLKAFVENGGVITPHVSAPSASDTLKGSSKRYESFEPMSDERRATLKKANERRADALVKTRARLLKERKEARRLAAESERAPVPVPVPFTVAFAEDAGES